MTAVVAARRALSSVPALTAAGTPSWARWVLLPLRLYGVVVLATLLLAPLHLLPAEDVVILHQYSRNLAQHGVISYYAGGPHAEGATDFGWMMLLAAAMRVGVSPAWFTAVANAGSLLVVAVLLLGMAGVRRSLPRMLALCGAAGLLPQCVAAVAGFAVLPEALLLTLLVLAVGRERVRAAALLALALCLFRPDGVLFAVPLLGLLLRSPGARRGRVLTVLLLYGLPGVAYFCWRTWYFGALLPLPFLVKADVARAFGVLVPHSLLQSSKYLLFLGACLLSLGRLDPVRRRLLLALVLVPTLFFWTMRLDQNVGDRFFFYLPLATALLCSCAWPGLSTARRGGLLATACLSYPLLLLGPFLREIRSLRDFQFRDVHELALGLRTLPVRGTLLTTEAGFLAFDSGWVTIDPWGLNTARFATHLVQPADVAALQPDLIVVHPPKGQGCRVTAAWPQEGPGRTWSNMTRNVLLGAQTMHRYDLLQLSYGSEVYRRRNHWSYGQGDPECFLVDRSSPDHDGMVQLLQTHHALFGGGD